jgi:hypothetical protein
VSPCRIIDTRLAGGPIATDATRDFNSSGTDFLAQGGDGSDCGIPADASAILVNVTVVAPTRQGYLTLYPYGIPRPLASQLNYEPGDIKANEVIVKQTLGQPFDFTVYANGATHVVADIAGYFMAPVATQFECVNATSATTTVAAGETWDLLATCPAGFSASGGGLDVPAGAHDMTIGESHPVNTNAWHTSGRNTSGATQILKTRVNCCRVPGR